MNRKTLRDLDLLHDFRVKIIEPERHLELEQKQNTLAGVDINMFQFRTL